MFLRIQKNESLRSYVERNLFISNRSPDSKALKNLYYRKLSISELTSISTKLGWQGCYNFNKLIHIHTGFPWYGVIKSRFDYSYSGSQYLERLFYGNGLTDSRVYCPTCAKEDKIQLGYSYWRRFHRCVKVCSKHNVVLLSACPFCDRPFASAGHAVDVMWTGCRGQHLGEAQPVVNTEPMALRTANFFDGLCSAKRHISDDTAVTVLDEKLTMYLAEGDTQLSGSGLVREFKFYVDHIDQRRSNQVRRFERYRRRLVELAALLYTSFDEFAHDCEMLEPNSPGIDFFWDTYCFPNLGSENFIREDCRLGVAEWSWPHFEEWKSDPFWDDYVRASKRPRHYRCCNPADSHLIGYQPTVHVQTAPAVPQLTESELVAMTSWATRAECLPAVSPTTRA